MTRAAGSDSPIIHVFVPKSRADALARVIAAQSAAKDTLEYKGVPSSPEGIEARQGMETRLTQADNSLRSLVAEVIDGAKVYQGGGSERLEASLLDKVKEAADASLDRLFYDFKDADDHRWPKVIERARKGAEHPLEVLDYSGKTEDHPVFSATLSFVGSGKKGQGRAGALLRSRHTVGHATPSMPRSLPCSVPGICERPPTARHSSPGSSIRRRSRAPTSGWKVRPSTRVSASRFANCS